MRGKDNNNKGAAICQAKVFQRIGNDYVEMAAMTDVTGLATHCSLSAANITFDGVTARRITVLGSPITGSGPAEVTFLDWDSGLAQLRYNRSRVAHAYPADAGKISNIYGENPNNQGRDYHAILADEALVFDIIREDLYELKKTADKRRTEISVEEVVAFDKEELLDGGAPELLDLIALARNDRHVRMRVNEPRQKRGARKVD